MAVMYDCYKKGLCLPSEFYDMKNNREGEYKILVAFFEYNRQKDVPNISCPILGGGVSNN